ncbi:MAG TPA: hypothetical protein VGR38_06130, partial [Candidatus Polarisedimenticolia bacterium]|nr:hypothetical protein [Candidatus Polarisedimenticolia bacterium]
ELPEGLLEGLSTIVGTAIATATRLAPVRFLGTVVRLGILVWNDTLCVGILLLARSTRHSSLFAGPTSIRRRRSRMRRRGRGTYLPER